MNTFEKDYYIGAGESDAFNLCRPSTVLLMLQDAATTHAESIGYGRNEIIEKYNSVWVLSRLYYKLNKPIRYSDTVHIKTWNRGLKGVSWYRDFLISVNGEEVGKASNMWVLVDIDARKIKRPDASLAETDAKSALTIPGYDISLNKIKAPEILSEAFVKTIRYSDLDVNNHVNNTKYADLCCDAISFEEMHNKFLSEFQINYQREGLINDRITLKTADITDSEKYVCGINENDNGSTFFEATLSFEKTEKKE